MRWSRGLPLASFLALASCVDGPGLIPFMGPRGDLPSLTRTAQTLATVREARDRWHAAAPARYRVEEQISCFCELTGVRVLEVVDTVVTRAWDRSTWRASGVMTTDLAVERLFDRAIAALEGGGSVSAAYDAAYGYPRDMYIDPLPQMVDDEANYRLATLTPF
jgi:hypothetical protein